MITRKSLIFIRPGHAYPVLHISSKNPKKSSQNVSKLINILFNHNTKRILKINYFILDNKHLFLNLDFSSRINNYPGRINHISGLDLQKTIDGYLIYPDKKNRTIHKIIYKSIDCKEFEYKNPKN